MKRVFTFWLASAAILLGACNETEQHGPWFGPGPYGTMSVNDSSYDLRSGYVMLPNEFDDNFNFMFCPDSFHSNNFDPYTAIELSIDPALLGVTTDLTKPLSVQGSINLIAYTTRAFAEITLNNRSVYAETTHGARLKIVEGTLIVERFSDRTELRFHAKIEDGTELSGSWNGPVKEVTPQYDV